MTLYRKGIYLSAVVGTILSTNVFCQEIGSPWIDMRGKNNKEVEETLVKEVATLSSYSSEIIEDTKNKLESENDKRTIDFNNRKVVLRTDLNTAIDEKNDISIEVNDLKDQLALNQSEVSALEQKITDADSSSTMSKLLIEGEKSRIKDELTKIPFFEVMIARVKNFPEDVSNVSDYDNKMSHEISRTAIENQLGVNIIKQTIVQDGTLTEDLVTTSLSGKANSNLTLALITVVNPVTNKLSFDRYRYGVVTVYPFQKEDVSLTVTTAMSGIDAEVEIVQNMSEGISRDLPDDEKRRLNNLLNEKRLKNGDSESQIKRLARNSKRLIALENSKIERNNKAVVDYKERIENILPIIEEFGSQLSLSVNDLTTAVDNFAVAQTDYENHVFSESYVEVFPWEGYASADESITDKYGEFAVESFQEFLTSIKSEYLREETEATRDTYSEIKESKKTDVVLNKIKLLGKFAESKGRRTQLSIYIAYNFGFEFEQAKTPDELVAVISPETTPAPKPAVPRRKEVRPPAKPRINLSVTSNPSGATVEASGKRLGKTPLKIYLEPGMYSLTVTKKGYQAGMDVIDVSSTGITSTELVLEPEEKVAKKSGNKTIIWAGVAILGGGAYFLLSGDSEPKTGSLSVTIKIP